MLRIFTLLLLLLNTLYFTWSQGMLADLGFAPAQQTEPQRIKRQINPDAVRLLSTQELQLPENNPDKPAPCLLSGPPGTPCQ
jgi:hypothetical protein